MTTEEWAMMTQEEIEKVKRAVGCYECDFRGKLGSETHCDYILITGHMRGCSMDECTKCRPAAGPRAKIKPKALTAEMMMQPRRKDELKARRVKIGQWINEGLKKKRMSIATLASIAGVSKTTAYHWSDGYSTPYPENIMKLAKILDIDPKDERVAWVIEENDRQRESV